MGVLILGPVAMPMTMGHMRDLCATDRRLTGWWSG